VTNGFLSLYLHIILQQDVQTKVHFLWISIQKFPFNMFKGFIPLLICGSKF